jgi:hypothetical protein
VFAAWCMSVLNREFGPACPGAAFKCRRFHERESPRGDTS